MAVWRTNATAWAANFGLKSGDDAAFAAAQAANAVAGYAAHPAARNAAYAADAAARAACGAATTASFAARAVDAAARAYTYADDAAEDAAAVAYNITNRSDVAIEAAIYDAATDADRTAAVASAARTLAVANAAARVAAAVMWEQLSDVASILEQTEDLEKVGRTAVPLGLADEWSKLSSALLKESPNWSVWINWYEDRLAGRPSDSNFEHTLLSITAEEWNLEPAAVNTLLAERMT